MPLSTVLGAQSLVQPAVCTTATRPASPYTGQAIYDTTTATQLIYNGTAFVATGRIVQLVQASVATQVQTTSSSYVTTTLNTSITPSLNTSKVLIVVSLPYSNAANQDSNLTIFRGTVAGTNLATNASVGFGFFSGGTQGISTPWNATFLDSPATTSATTYTVGMKTAGGTAAAFIGNAQGTITLIEVLV